MLNHVWFVINQVEFGLDKSNQLEQNPYESIKIDSDLNLVKIDFSGTNSSPILIRLNLVEIIEPDEITLKINQIDEK